MLSDLFRILYSLTSNVIFGQWPNSFHFLSIKNNLFLFFFSIDAVSVARLTLPIVENSYLFQFIGNLILFEVFVVFMSCKLVFFFSFCLWRSGWNCVKTASFKIPNLATNWNSQVRKKFTTTTTTTQLGQPHFNNWKNATRWPKRVGRHRLIRFQVSSFFFFFFSSKSTTVYFSRLNSKNRGRTKIPVRCEHFFL